jgi:type II restriction/modification system DNA methylase subunit YeeA
MNKAKLKTYAPQARRDFIQMIRQRADLLGLTKREIEQPQITGDIALIEGRPYPKRYAELHKRLAEKIRTEGLEQFIERIAYSWFNRFAALRFMEVNNFLSHGFRVLSSREAGKNEPEILTHAAEIDLPGLDKNKVLELKLAGNKDAELYRQLLIAQCNELHRAMPFLFEKINDETEILLPDNLLHSDSVIRKMVAAIDEEDWAEVEIIGWLYQFYISEKKDEVIGKTVKSEDIPAATQLFTPNWIVKYMTQNSLGRLWLENNPHSALAQNMEFYIKPAEENSNPKSEIQNPKSALSPEEIRVLDPACGSGHILVEAYELLKQIYTERGYSSRDIPLLILEKNLFGLDIDERAAQMASFALLMKARRDDRRIFEKLSVVGGQWSEGTSLQIRNPQSQIPNIAVVPDSSHLEAHQIAEMFLSREEQAVGASSIPIRDSNYLLSEVETQPSLIAVGETKIKVQSSKFKDQPTEQNIIDLLSLFEQGKTLGSLIRIPPRIGAVVDKLEKAIQAKREGGNFLEQIAARELEPFVQAAKMLANKYDCVIANPPYMGGKGMNAELKAFAAKNFPDSKSDLFAMFIERGFELLKKDCFNAMVTMQSWMFLSSFEKMRERLLDEKTIVSMVHMANGVMGIAFGTNATIWRNYHLENYNGDFSFVTYEDLTDENIPREFPVRNERLKRASAHDFKKIPGSPIAYWVSDKMREVFEKGTFLGDIAPTKLGMTNGDNNRFIRLWFEIDNSKVGLNATSRSEAKDLKKKWFPYNKGGDFRKWYGNNDYFVNWENDGQEILQYNTELYGSPTRNIRSISYYFKPSITWSFVSSSFFGVRRSDAGFIFDVGGSSAFPNDKFKNLITGFLCTNLAFNSMKAMNPTLNFQTGNVAALPILESKINEIKPQVDEIVEEAVAIARADWDSFETSWDFERLPIADCGLRNETNSVEECWQSWKNLCDERIMRMQELETENNRLFIEAYGLEDELSPEVPLEQITLARADAEKDTRRLASYFIGCLMGRYSLDAPGLIYADAGGKGFDPSRYQTFPADDDGIVPVTDLEWFPQEAARQFESFVRTIWGEANLHSNLRWIAEQLGGKAAETPLETVRRYFSGSFFKDHLQTYKKRPIYWLFSSGKQKAFECLVYLHRYNEATLPRMRHEYVLPLMSKLSATIEIRDAEIEKAESTSEKNKLIKQREILVKKQTELAAFDEKLRHLADQKISLDLDDGVKVNYGKFGDLLAEVKQVAATKE